MHGDDSSPSVSGVSRLHLFAYISFIHMPTWFDIPLMGLGKERKTSSTRRCHKPTREKNNLKKKWKFKKQDHESEAQDEDVKIFPFDVSKSPLDVGLFLSCLFRRT